MNSYISEQAAFFDHLVELIPAKHYSGEEEHVEVRYLSKSDKKAAKEDFKKKYRENKKAKLDPSSSAARTKSGPEGATAEQSASIQRDENDEPVPASRDILREKLQKRLEEMRKQRKADESQKKVKEAKQWKEKAMEKGRQKAAPHQKQARQKVATETIVQKKGAMKGDKKHGSEFTFGKLEFGEEGRDGKRKQKLSKQELLSQTEAEQRNDISEQERKAKAWKSALARAHGNKVLDDPKLLKKSIKKENKMKEKKAKAWADRQEKLKESQQQRQQKRKDNIKAKIDGRKQSKKDKREKKLLRAGFEGRKNGYISTPSK